MKLKLEIRSWIKENRGCKWLSAWSFYFIFILSQENGIFTCNFSNLRTFMIAIQKKKARSYNFKTLIPFSLKIIFLTENLDKSIKITANESGKLRKCNKSSF